MFLLQLESFLPEFDHYLSYPETAILNPKRTRLGPA
jgi:hypothetical protein